MQISFPLPERQFVAEPVDDVTEKVRLYAALGMVLAAELSMGAACELAGVDRYIFLDFCKRKNVSLRTQTPDELEKDLHQLIDKG